MKWFNKIILTVYLSFLGLSINGWSQIFPPDFECIFSDTLFWQPAVNSCGPFISTDIYRSNFPFGPFSLVTSINNPAITKFLDLNPSGEDRFYYLISNHNCPGEITINSDTLSNLPLQKAPLISATVNNNAIELSWEPSPSPQVSAYIIFRTSPMGTMPIDTVFGIFNTTYTDLGASPGLGSNTYFIIATDPCNNTSNFNQPHSTIYLRGNALDCDESISLEWLRYKGWTNATLGQEVHLSIAGAPFTKVADLPSGDSTYQITNISSGFEYCVKILAREANTGVEVCSNEFCITPDIKEPVTTLQLDNLSVRSDNTVALTWYWETDIEINSFEFRSGAASDNLQPNFSGLPGIILSNETTRIDPNSDASVGPIYYQITTIDDCGREFSSNLGRTIFLNAVAGENLQNQLSWTDFELEGATFNNYRLFRTELTGDVEIILDDPLTTNINDTADPTDPDQAELCYFVEAEYSIVQPDGIMRDFVSKSNTACVRQESNIFVPNAFVPGGVNSLFKPLLVFDEGVSFNMKIFNRWGALIFETDDYLKGWDGRNGLQEMPMGGYVYAITVIQPDGVIQEKKGTVVLIR